MHVYIALGSKLACLPRLPLHDFAPTAATICGKRRVEPTETTVEKEVQGLLQSKLFQDHVCNFELIKNDIFNILITGNELPYYRKLPNSFSVKENRPKGNQQLDPINYRSSSL